MRISDWSSDVCSSDLIERFADVLHALSVNNPRLNQEIVRQSIEDGTADHLVERLREEAMVRNAIVVEAFEGITMRSHPGALHCYIELPPPCRPNDFTAPAPIGRASGRERVCQSG